MTLNDFMNMAYSKSGMLNVRFTVFDDDDSFDVYAKNAQEKDAKLFTVNSAYVASAFLLEKYANAQVEHFCAAREDEVFVIIKPRDTENTCTSQEQTTQKGE